MILSPVTIWKKFDLTRELNAETKDEPLSPAGFCVQSVTFSGHLTNDGERVKIYARFTRPCGEEKAPALLLLPDAFETGEELADYFAMRGYATLIPDYCGKRACGNTTKKNGADGGTYKNEQNNADGGTTDSEKAAEIRNETRYTQYPACVAYADYDKAGTLDRLEGENVEKSAWFEWAYVALYALEYLKTRSDVAKIGVAGVRLGGEIAWMTMLSPDICCGVAINAAGWRSHAGVSKFGGAPVVAQGEEAEALRSFIAGVEAESYAPFVKCPVLMCCAMEDTFFDCDRAYDTFVRLGNAEGSAIVYSSNSGKCIGPNALADLDLFLECHLKGRQIYIPKPLSLSMRETEEGTVEITVSADADALVNTLSVYYAEGRGGQNSSCRAWQRLRKIAGGELKNNGAVCTCEPFAGAEYAFAYAIAECVNGFKTVSPVAGKKLREKKSAAVKSRVISSGEKDGFAVADYESEAVGGIILEKESMPETAAGYGGIRGVYSHAGIRTYRISSPRFVADEGAALKLDLYAAVNTSAKITVETGERGASGEYSAVVPVSGGGKWKRIILRAEEFKDEATGAPLKSFSRGIAIVIRPENEKVKVLAANVLWL
ncbi:MAG: hypothetical protein SPH68_07725 [Candidatus Borkfalkiaceae bacterium]|nr:hypothetical protein [Clostridia bacterium]MDY6224029.1 hypothetical protein [Christensenellaceae bacterium]